MKKYIISILSLMIGISILRGQTTSEFGYPDQPNTSSSEKEPVILAGGTFEVSQTGSAQYSVPIEIPQGIGGLQPSLAISYNSQGMNGVVGWGFNLSGLSAITRGPKNSFYDGSEKGLTFAAGDAYFLDGKRLILSSGNDLQEGAVYYLEDDPQTKVTAHGTYNTSMATTWFEIQHSNGMKYYYGNTASARQSYRNYSNNPRIYSWYLDYAEDAMGNYMNYSYSIDNYIIYLINITYGKNKNNSNGGIVNTIDFLYNGRLDITPFFIEGIKGGMSSRLTSITVKTENQIYRTYDLVYDVTSDATETKYSRLTSITIKNSAGEASKPITFNWTFRPSFYQNINTIKINPAGTYPSMEFTEQRFFSGDFNGDGLTDLLGIAPVRYPTGQNDTFGYIYYASLDSDGNPQFITGNNYQLGSNFNMGDWTEQKGGPFVMDFDGDGVNELLVPNAIIINSIGVKYIEYPFIGGIWNGKSIKHPLKQSSELPLYTTADVNRDGKGELIYIEKGHSNNIYPGGIITYKSDMDIEFAYFNFTLPSKPQKIFLSDYNGDGLQDLMVVHEKGYTIYWNQGNGISASTFTDSKKTTGTNILSNGWTMMRSGDFNGDGLADFVINDTNSLSWYIAINQGNGTFVKAEAASIYAYDQSSTSKDDDKFECFVQDFDNDGKDDLIIVKTMYNNALQSHAYTYWMRSTGTQFIKVSEATSNRLDDGLAYRYVAGDFNGDGIPDLINYGHNCYNSNKADVNPSWRLYTWGSINGKFTAEIGKVKEIKEGAGNTIKINYASMVNNDFYTKGSGSTYPVVDLAIPLHGVVSVLADNGAAGTESTTYQYKGLKTHIAGKGLLGMTSFISNNTTQGIVSESGIKSWNSSFYIPSSTYSKTTMDGKTGESNVTFTIVDKSNKKYFAYPSTKIEKDLDGNTVTSTCIYNTTYGYMEEEKADFGEDMYKTVQYQNYVKAGNMYKPQLIVKTQKHSDDDIAYSNKTTISYDISKGYQKQIIKNQGTNLALTTDYTYDIFGNVLTIKEIGSGIIPVTKHNEYDSSGRFVTKTYTSPATTVRAFAYDTWGNLLTEKDESVASNNLTTTYAYDKWGNLTSTVFPDGSKATVTRGWNSNQSQRYYILTQGTGEPWVKTWYDVRGREVLIETIGEKSQKIQTSTVYNSKGLTSSKTVQTGNLTSSENYTYDAMGRLASSSNSSGQSNTYSYDNRKTTTVINGKTYEKTFDAWGGTKSSTDPVSSVKYTYSSLGKPQKIVVGNATYTMKYDAIGNQTELIDPNAGTLTYTYDAAERLTKQVDDKGIITLNSFDALGRLATSTIDGIATSYTYGTSGNDYMLLIKEQTGDNYLAYSHDKYGRVISENRQITGEDLLGFSYEYNTKGEISRLVYPGNVQVNNQYDAYGNLVKVMLGAQSIWELTGATGTVRTSTLGGALTSTTTHNSQGLLTNIKTVKGSSVLHNMNFVFDGATGNLGSRTGMVAYTETFEYDNVNRLKSVKNGNTDIMEMTYRNNGNISSKTGLGKYGYKDLPHAVSHIENTDGLTPTAEQLITYTGFNKVETVSETVGTDVYLLNFTYGPDRQRWKTELKKNGVSQKTFILAVNYETVTEDGKKMELYYINGSDGTAAIYVKQPGQTDKIYYPHFDYLGSVVKITDINGTEVFKASYDAWGNRTVSNKTFAWHRGYTGHEHLDEFRLIDMNGRMYDPILGRFLSPDPYVQMPDFSQNFNRYSYVLNNPLRYTDPSGEWFGIDDLFVAGAGFVLGYLSHGITEGNWGGKALGAGAMGAVSGWLGYNTGGLATGKITGTTWGTVGGMAANKALAQVTPSMPIPINKHFSLSVSPGLGWGTSGLTGGVNYGAVYSNGDLSIGAGFGIGVSGVNGHHWGWNGAMTINGWGAGYGRTYYSASSIAGQEYGKQIVGTWTGYFNHNSFSVSNDKFGDKGDRWRTSAAELNIGKYSIGTYLYTNDGGKDSDYMTDESENCVPPWPVGRNGNKGLSTWTNGRVHFAPAYIGYRKGNQITRIGFSHKIIHNLTQNWVHKGFGKQNYYMSYDEFRSGGYFYSGYYNPHSLWER